MPNVITPDQWVDVDAVSYEDFEDSVNGTFDDADNSGFSSYMEALQAEATAEYAFSGVVQRNIGEFEDTITIEDDFRAFIDEFSVRFNESNTAPGFIVTVEGVTGLTFSVFRRDPTGNLPDRRVRGLANITAVDDDLEVTDYEAPLGVVLHYYFQIAGQDSIVGPVLPTPQPYIPTLRMAYGQGVVFAKLIDTPEASIPLLVEEWKTWERPARVYAEHTVLDREFPIIITDVMGSRRGNISGHVILAQGMHISRVERLIKSGTTILLQNNNVRISGMADMYVRITKAEFVRNHVMVPWGQQDEIEDPRQASWTYRFSYIEEDRPDPTNVVIDQGTWGTLIDINASGRWRDLLEVYDDEGIWFNLLEGDVS